MLNDAGGNDDEKTAAKAAPRRDRRLGGEYAHLLVQSRQQGDLFSRAAAARSALRPQKG